MSELERVRYDLFVGINTQTFAEICNSAICVVSLCVSAHRHRVPFLGIQPSNVPSRGSLEQLATLPGTVDDRIWDKTYCCAIICILVAVVIISQWRTPRCKQELQANPYTVPLALTLMLVAVFLLDHAYTLLCARWERSTQVIFVAHCISSSFLHLPRWSGKLLRVVSCATSSTFEIPWLLNVLFGASFCELRVVCCVPRPRTVNWCVQNLEVLRFLWAMRRQNEGTIAFKSFLLQDLN